MSADNWRECPRCALQNGAAYAQALSQLKSSYGKIPVDEWLKAKDRVSKLDIGHNDVDTNFCENYEFYWVNNTTVIAEYRGECKDCGFRVSFRHEHPVGLTSKP